MQLWFLTLGYHPDLTGGAFRYVTEVAERLAGRGHRVELVCPASGPVAPPEEGRNGVVLHRYPNPKGSFLVNWMRENRSATGCLRRFQTHSSAPAVAVVCHAYLGPASKVWRGRRVSLFTGPWAEEYRFSRLVTGQPPARQWLTNWIVRAMRRTERGTLRRADRILTISRYTKSNCLSGTPARSHRSQWSPAASMLTGSSRRLIAQRRGQNGESVLRTACSWRCGDWIRGWDSWIL